jgi:hypothetical protein
MRLKSLESLWILSTEQNLTSFWLHQLWHDFSNPQFRWLVHLNETSNHRWKGLPSVCLQNPPLQSQDVLIRVTSELIKWLTDMIGAAARGAKDLPLATAEQLLETIAISRTAVGLLRRRTISKSIKSIACVISIGLYPLKYFECSKLLISHSHRCTRYVNRKRQPCISMVTAYRTNLPSIFNMYTLIANADHSPFANGCRVSMCP